MKKKITDHLTEIVKRIVNEVSPEKIILFGSRAKKKAAKNSDIDLLIIEAAPFNKDRSRIKEIGKLEKAIGNIPIPTDLLVYSEDEIEKWKYSTNHIIFKAINEGKVLYARS